MSVHAAAPAVNPGFLDTLTWDERAAARLTLRAVGDGRFAALAAAVAAGTPDGWRGMDRLVRRASRPPLALAADSATAHARYGLFLVGLLEDGQRVLVAVSPGERRLPGGFGQPLGTAELSPAGRRGTVRIYPLDLARLRVFLAEIAPAYAPAVPDRPGLGIGCRMGVLDIPAALRVIRTYGLCASAIQSSVYRELAPLADLSRLPVPQIDLPGVGLVPLGHTGMSITGQYLAMTVERIVRGDSTPTAVDADHLPLRGARGAGWELTRRLVREAADRSLFTLDPHFCFYGGETALMRAAAEGRMTEIEAAFRKRFSRGARTDLAARYVGKTVRVPDPAGAKRLVVEMSASELADSAVRFQEPLAAIEGAVAEIRRVKGKTPFAVEVSVDEVPGLSEPHHFFYLCAELARRGIAAFSLAPGLGFSKLDVDVTDPEGAFATRVRILAGISSHFGAVMGIHSGDGKSVSTRKVLAKATGGSFWYKVSPDRQRTFFRSLGVSAPGSEGRQLFQELYRSALARVIGLAGGGSEETARVARQTLLAVTKGTGLSRGTAREIAELLNAPQPPRASVWPRLARRMAAASSREVPGDPTDHLVHDYAFATVGARDARGRFRLRGRFFGLPDEALAIYRKLDTAYLSALVRSLGLDR
ncbi:MAG: tagaturonate epimerase family protein [Candidatus Methylomirabilota bacterium]